MVSLADALVPSDWMHPQPAPRIKPPACPMTLAQMQRLIDGAPTKKARAFYQQRLNFYLEATENGG